ncbi:MAG: PspC domain-containing protein [Candidatus Levybacteria bacterium]|nr:PspC domain-containing protein [Candidatus Levybacteria bacterium]
MATKKSETSEKVEEPRISSPMRLYRSETNRILGGVAGGIGEYANIDPTLVRIVFILLTLFGGSGLLLYIVLWIVVPSESTGETNDPIRENIAEMKGRAKNIAASMRIDDQQSYRPWGAIILIAVGLIIILNNFGYYDIDLGKLWPIVLILLGILLLRRK